MPHAFERLTKSLDAPLAVVTTAAEGEVSGCLVGFHGQAGIDPECYALWLSKANHTYRVALRAEHFAVHFPHADDPRHVEVARHFGTRTGGEEDKLATLEWQAGPDGVPLLADLPDRMVLRPRAMLDVGSDHVLVAAEAVEAWCTSPFSPLRLHVGLAWDPGHEADEREIHPGGDG